MKGGPGTVYTTIKDSVFFLTIKILDPSPATTLFGDTVLLPAFSIMSLSLTHTSVDCVSCSPDDVTCQCHG